MPSRAPALLAVDGGNSKLDAVLLTARGQVLGAARGGGSSWSVDDEERSIAALRHTIRRACIDAGLDPDRRPVARLAMYCLAGADLPADDRRLVRLLKGESLSEKIVLRNDTFAVLRAGTARSWGVGVVCGTGLNCSAVAPDGRTVRYPTTGEYSGDFGGGGWMGQQALSAAIRGRDGRSPRTALERDVPAHFGLRRPLAVAEAIHVGTVPYSRLSELAPVVFRASEEGDHVAGGIIDTLADEVVAMVASAIRRLHMTRRDVEVVLGGGIVRSGDARFRGRIEGGILSTAPAAQISMLHTPPVVGAALLGLDLLSAGASAQRNVRGTLTQERFSDITGGNSRGPHRS
jgi:N-acetylglucosamine kinase-like BadF-type ATPase